MTSMDKRIHQVSGTFLEYKNYQSGGVGSMAVPADLAYSNGSRSLKIIMELSKIIDSTSWKWLWTFTTVISREDNLCLTDYMPAVTFDFNKFFLYEFGLKKVFLVVSTVSVSEPQAYCPILLSSTSFTNSYTTVLLDKLAISSYLRVTK